MPYRVKGGKHQSADGIMHVSGEMYEPTNDELQAFGDKFEEMPAQRGRPPLARTRDVPEDVESSEAPYEVVERSVGWYNVVDAYGTVQNTAALRLHDAEALRDELMQKAGGGEG